MGKQRGGVRNLEQIADIMSRNEPPASNPLTPHLLVDPEDDRGLCHEFLSEAVSRFPEDETVREALLGAVEEMSRQLSKMTMNDDYKPYIHVSTACRLPIRFRTVY